MTQVMVMVEYLAAMERLDALVCKGSTSRNPYVRVSYRVTERPGMLQMWDMVHWVTQGGACLAVWSWEGVYPRGEG
jgi:hypothetical protein